MKPNLDEIEARRRHAKELHNYWAQYGGDRDASDLAVLDSWQDITALLAYCRSLEVKVKDLDGDLEDAMFAAKESKP